MPPRVETAARGVGPLSAGAAAVPIALPPGVPIGGFARLSYRSEPPLQPIEARAVVLSEPGCSIALASIEILLVPEALDRAVRSRVADLGLDGVVIAATHTHAGPGGYWDRWPGERLATGPYDPAAFGAVVRAAAEAIRAAASARVPVRLSVSAGRVNGLARNRSGGPVDARLLVARAEAPGGRPIAEIAAFPAHPTILGGSNRRISGDWPGALVRLAPGVRLFFQGAVGDQSVLFPGGQATGPEDYARALSVAIASAPGDPESSPRLGYAAAEVLLPRLDPAAAPALLRPAARTLLAGAFPERARVQAVRLGPALLLFAPGEPVAEVAAGWRARAGDGAEVISLAGGYLGYVETPEKIRAGVGEARHALYAADLAERLGAGALAAARAADGQ